ncbi:MULTISPECIES: urease accessory protein UreD [unclassified Dysgonomonas]|uniref:urease accessory protein UreD n=1 Tax=unclassified Dysgonomonas TaxID=2630389 RepID=UPI0006809905|nr:MULTISPECIES: urease accessory protein UreD [unclassified Dysgonomonas]MBD8347588.1 urease accessory protein UreD [Dysgonomonas sp. HGC4]MBF0576952.1 urease accessory protein UreD [Dysgonomonas sp. GY617]
MINKLDLKIGHKDGQTYLKDTYFTRPFRLANVGENRPDPALYLMIMSSSPGILDNDCYDIDITAEKNARLQLQTQSYQRLFKMEDGASQKMIITLEENSEISYIQHPIVPHEHSIFKAHNSVYMDSESIFTYGEIITCGRKHSGEIFLFKEFQNLTEIYHNNKLIIKDNILIEPALMNLNSIGQLEGYTHQATLLHVNTRNEDINSQAEYIHDLLSLEEDIIYGVSQPLPNSIIVRILGNGGEQLLDSFKEIEKYLWELNTPSSQTLEKDLISAKKKITSLN